MMILYEIALAALFVACLGLFILVRGQAREIEDLRSCYYRLDERAEGYKNKVVILKNKTDRLETQVLSLVNNKDVIEIIHKYDDNGAPKFPSKGGF